MSEKMAVEFDGVGKMYRLYKSRMESFLDITSLGRVAPWWNPKIENFWALRNVSFKLNTGSRLGIIGRNGAGKTTLLKLMTGNITPTEGRIRVQGEVQALLEAGAGFHPEFSGYENIEASLIQNGLNPSEIKAAVDEIADFTELGDFLNQPFKTYSAGMQARLVFTTATTIKPDILIIDEILGAGDAYFAVKSRGRMKQLVDSGASILLVAHAMDQILQFCEEAIWLERGRIVVRGPSLEVVKAYDEFIHTLQDRQLKAANRRRRLGFRDAVDVGHFAETFIVALSLKGAPGARADISRVELRCEDIAEETVRIGDAQDSDQTHFAYIALGTGAWSEPGTEEGGHFRSLTITSDGPAAVLGEMVFRSYALEQGKRYSFRVRFRILGEGQLVAAVSRNGRGAIHNMALPNQGSHWQEQELALNDDKEAPPVAPADSFHIDFGSLEEPVDKKIEDLAYTETEFGGAAEGTDEISKFHRGDTTNCEPGPSGAEIAKPTVRRWPGEGSLLIEGVSLLGNDGEERAVYPVGSALTLRLDYRAMKEGSFPIIFAIAIYTPEGVKVTQHISSSELVHVEVDERRSVQLQFPSLDLANGRYVISVALHRDLDPQFPDETVRYDLLSYSYEFEVVGNPPLRTSLFVLPAAWKL